MAGRCRQAWNNLHPGLRYGIVMGVIIVLALFVSLFLYPAFPQGEFTYVNAPQSGNSYAGPVNIPKSLDIPGDLWMPNFDIKGKQYSTGDVMALAEKFGMHCGSVDDGGEFYEVNSANATLIVHKHGLYLRYCLRDVPIRNVTLSKEEIIDVAEKYLDTYSFALPQGVSLKFDGISTGRFFQVNGTRVNYTMKVDYSAHFRNYLVDLPVSIEIDSRGKLVGLNSETVSVEMRDFVVIPSFREALEWMESHGIPLPQEYDNLYNVTLVNVTEGYALSLEDGGKLMPAYYVVISIRDFYGVEIDSFSFYVAWNY